MRDWVTCVEACVSTLIPEEVAPWASSPHGRQSLLLDQMFNRSSLAIDLAKSTQSVGGNRALI